MNKLHEQLEEVLIDQPGLAIQEVDDGYTISGKFVMNAEYNDIPLYDEYEVEISVSNRFPETIPSVKCLGDNIPSAFEHLYYDGNLCLGATCELYDFMAKKKSLVSFVNEIVMSYFYSVSYFKRYGDVPYGERSHGVKGIEEAYMERYGISDENVLHEILTYLLGIQRYRGHIDCPCGSGERFRKCHGKLILKDILSPLASIYQSDALSILKACLNERKG